MKSALFLLGLLLGLILAPTVRAGQPLVGVNLVNAPYDLTVSEQEAILAAMQAAGVRVIRGAIPANEKGIDWAERVYAHGIEIEWLIDLVQAPGTAWPHPPEGFKGMWEEPALSKADPDRFRAEFSALLVKLEAKGIVLAALELGNEFNWAGFNADFELPGQGRVLVASDLVNDPEGRQVVKGYMQYLKTLAVLKEIRDRSSLNRSTPILSGGLADLSDSTWPNQRRADAVDVSATFDFLRGHGLNDLVDGYGIHAYPRAPDAAGQLAHLQRNGLSYCRTAGSSQGKRLL